MLVLPIIQARSNSTRLPGKITKSFANNLNTLDHVILTLKSLGLNPIVATTQSKSDDKLVEIYEKEVKIFRGNEIDVLSRFTSIIEQFKPDYIIRICADNPFLFKDGISFLIDQAMQNPNFDYLSFSIWGKPAMKVSLGIFAELIKSEALMQKKNSQDPLDREHVTINLYGKYASNFSLFSFEDIFFPISSNIRLTMDTFEDFENINQIIDDLKVSPPFDQEKLKEIIKYICNHELINKMKIEDLKSINSKNYSKEKGK